MNAVLIKGGTVIDGAGAPRFRADVRIEGGVIREIAPSLVAKRERVVDARDCIVAPGFIESHTHYDGTMWWQPDLDPLPGYGVTTAIMGNCGFSVAPVRDDPAARLEILKIFSFFEDIPLGPFEKNVPWTWRSWPQYWDTLRRNVRTPLNCAAFVGHVALRLAVMGLEAWERAATPEEVLQMARLLDEALRSGALGLSTNLMDYDEQGRPIPTLRADDAELVALMDVLARYPGTVLQVVVDIFIKMTAPQSVDRLARLAAGRNIRVQIGGAAPMEEYQASIRDEMLMRHERHKAQGLDFWAGFAHVAPTSAVSLGKSLIFAQTFCYPWHEVVKTETDEAKRALLADPAWRARARKAWDGTSELSPWRNPHLLHLVNSDNGVGPVDMTLDRYALERGIHLSDAMADWYLANGIQSSIELQTPPLHEETLLRMLRDPKSVGNVSDAGAHGQMLCGGGENMLLFTEFARNELISVEEAVHVQTGKLAGHFGLAGRGTLKAGNHADIVVFHLDEIARRPRKKASDVPDGKDGFTWRWTRDPAPVRLTMVGGVSTFENGVATGERSGQLLAPAATEEERS